MREEARQAIREGNIDRALELWRQITAADPKPALLLEHASLLFALHRFREARVVLGQLGTHPDATPGDLLPAAKLLFRIGRHRECARLTAKALSLDPDSADIAAIHAASLERSGEVDQARSLLEQTLGQHPKHLRSVRLLAHIDRRDGRFERGRQRLEKHLARDSSAEDWRLRYELAAILDRLGEHEAAIKALAIAKHQLGGQAKPHHSQWRAITARQWDLTTSLDPARLEAWATPAQALTPPLRLCLMAGFPRSGTTLLEQILSSHADCLGTDETGILTTQFRDPLVLARASAAEALAELDALGPEDVSVGRAEYLRCTGEYLGEDLGNRLLIEKDPLLTCDLVVPLRLFPEAKILMPLRDPRDVVISFFFTMVPIAPNSVAAINLGDSCRYYAEVMRHWLHLREDLDPGRWFESRYEDLLAEPEEQTRRLAAFLGLDWSPDMLAHDMRASERTISTPTYDDASKPLYTRSLGRWENYRRWLEPHLHHLEPFLEAFDYR